SMISEVAVGDRVVRVPKILCVARNYADHAKEMGTPVPQEPIFFLKPTTALLPGGGTILLPPESKRVEVETELAVILKAGGRDVSGRNPPLQRRFAKPLIISDRVHGRACVFALRWTETSTQNTRIRSSASWRGTASVGAAVWTVRSGRARRNGSLASSTEMRKRTY